MFGIGWTEMLVLGVVALIVIGPKDLPVLMNRLGKAVATIRRMGSEFQREINKTTGLDQITDLRRSITEPLKQTATQIRDEFNKPLTGGGVAPSGAIKPKDPKVESVVDEIHEKVGMTPPSMEPAPQPYTPFTKEAQEKYRAEQAAEKAGTAAKAVESPAPVEAIAPVKRPRAPRKPKVAAVADTPAPVDLLDGVPPIKTPKPRKPRAAAKPKSEA
jgi:sec-independent protein translocase protein TatB